MRDVSEEIAALRKRLAEAAGYLKIDQARARRPQLETEASRPDLWDDADAARRITSELSAVSEDVDLFDALSGRVDDVETLFELSREEDDDSVAAEIEQALDSLRAEFAELELRSLFTGEH